MKNDATNTDQPLHAKQERVKLSERTPLVADEYTLLTVVVNASNAVFYYNKAALETVVLPRSGLSLV